MDFDHYRKAVDFIAENTLKRFGAKRCRKTLPSFYDEAVRAFVQENVQYSSWIVSPKHAEFVIRTRSHSSTLVDNNKEQVARQYMQQDVLEACSELAERGRPAFWKIQIVPAKRFAVKADVDEYGTDSVEEIVLQNDDDVNPIVQMIQGGYTRLGLSAPELRPVAFTFDGKEAPQ